MRKIWKYTFAAVLSAGMILGTPLSCLASDIDQKIDQAAAKVEAAEAQNAKLEDRRQQAQAELEKLHADLSGLEDRISRTQSALDKKAEEIAAAEEEYTRIQLSKNDQYQAMKKRIQFLYEQGDTSMLMTFLNNAESLAEFMSRSEYASTLSAYDRAMLADYQEVLEEVKMKELDLQAEYEAFSALLKEHESAEAELSRNVSEQGTLIAELETQLGAGKEEAAQLRAQLEEYRAQKAAEEEQVRLQETSPFGKGSGVLCNPCPSGYLSSDFGYRSFDNSNHKGIDLATYEGAPILAAADGTVVIAGCSASAGNWVVIDHGNGLVTKYMHNSQLYVSEGQTVSAGETIAAAGTTGYSTGTHCHFQVEFGGIAVNPWDYL